MSSLMLKAESGPPRLASATTTDAAPEQRDPRANGGGSAQGDIGFVGLGRMGTPMAKNLVPAGHRVIACVRLPEQMGTLLGLGLKPSTHLSHLFSCRAVNSIPTPR